MKRVIFGLLLMLATASAVARINRREVVERHRIVTIQLDRRSPAQVGNGTFAMGVDVTGLQTFVPFNTMADWAWHSFPLPAGVTPAEYQGLPLETWGRQVMYPLPDPEKPELTRWLAGNPHKVNLGRMGLILRRANGQLAKEEDLEDVRQEVDLWTGLITSTFSLEGIPVTVVTACHPRLDMIAVEVKSRLIALHRLAVKMEFPYARGDEFQDYLGTMDRPEAHTSTWLPSEKRVQRIERVMDDLHYDVELRWQENGVVLRGPEQVGQHRTELEPTEGQELHLTCQWAREKHELRALRTQQVMNASRKGWKDFWTSGAAIDLSGSTDPRWMELERRIVLSQYVMRMNEAGMYPPQESGLVNNGWYGRHHMEMLWWHGVHYGYWNRWPLVERMTQVYQRYLPTSKERAEKQGYRGARWPKCTATLDREWPDWIHATLVWQQPHAIYLAEEDYRLHPNKKTLEKWADVVWETARWMADMVHWDEATHRYVMGPPLTLVSENTDRMRSLNPTFELSYWRYGLRLANEWRQRLHLPVDAQWKHVEENLAQLPVEDGTYVTYEGIENMWGKYNFEHPALIGALGMLPGDGVDVPTMKRTLDRVHERWNLGDVWGWDFPMLAMCAARLGQTERAIDYLLEYPGFHMDVHGLVGGGRAPFPYFPGNGGLLTAIAMMAGGWDDCPSVNAPGFPSTGWNVKREGFVTVQ